MAQDPKIIDSNVIDAAQIVADKLAPEVRAGVDAGVEDELNKVRSGNAGTKFTGIGFLDGIIDFIISIVFNIAEALGYGKQVASLMGKTIPDEGQKQAIADQITNSASRVLTAKNREGGFALENMNSEQLQDTLQSTLESDMRNNSALRKFMSDEDIVKAARSATDKLMRGEEELRSGIDMIGKMSLSADSPVAISGNTPQEQVSSVLNTVFTPLAGKDNPALPPLVESATQTILANRDKLGSAEAITQQIIADIKQSPEATKAAGALGYDLNDPATGKLLTQMLQPQLDVLKKAAEGKVSNADMVGVATVQVDIGATVNQNVEDSIRAKTADKIVSTLNETGIVAWGKRKVFTLGHEEVLPAKETVEKYRKTPPTDEAGRAELTSAENTLVDRATGMGRSPNREQRSMISDITSKTIIATLRDPENKSLGADALAAQLEKNIETALKNDQSKIDALGKPIASINDKIDADVFAEVAKGTAEFMRQDGGKQITALQGILLQQDAQALSASIDKNGMTTGLPSQDAGAVQAQVVGLGSTDQRRAI